VTKRTDNGQKWEQNLGGVHATVTYLEGLIFVVVPE